MTVRRVELEYGARGQQDQEEVDMYAGDVVVAHFKTLRRGEMEEGGHGGSINIAAHKGPAATRRAVLSLTPEDFDHPVTKEDGTTAVGADQTTTTIYCNFNEKEKYGVVLEYNTDYYWNIKIVNGPDTNCAALINLTGR